MKATQSVTAEAPLAVFEPSLSLSLLVRTLALFFAEGLSVGLLGWALPTGAAVLPYSLDNRATPLERSALLAAMFGCGALFALSAIASLSLSARPDLARLNGIARRLAPLTLVGLLPFLFRWQLWQARELTYAVFASLLGFGVHAAVLCSLKAPPLFGTYSTQWSRAAERLGRRLEGWLPTTLVVLGVLGYASFFSYHTIANHYNLRTASLDLGLESNLIWNLIHGGPFMKTSPLSGPTGSHFGFHATLFAYVIGLFYAAYPKPETLLAFQSIMIGLAALPLYLLGRRYIGIWSACVLALCYVFYPPVHGSNLYDFHYLPLGVFFIWLTVFLVEAGRYRWAVLATILTLSVREDVAAGLGLAGIYLLFSGRKPRAGLVLSAVAFGYFIVLKGIIMPRFLHGDSSFVYIYKGLLPPGEQGFSGVLKTAFGNPVFTLTSLLEQEKLFYMAQIGAPLCFFAWRRPIGVLCSAAGILFTLLSTGYLPVIQISFQYTAHWTTFLFLAVLNNLAWVRKPSFAGDVEGPTRQRAWVISIAILTLFTTYQYGAILQQNTARGGFGPYIFGTTDQDRQRYAQLMKLIAKVPPKAKIVSSENVVPHTTERPDTYTLREDVFDAEYLLVLLPVGGDEFMNVRKAFSQGFGVMEVDGPFFLAKRGYPQTKNASVLSRVH
ncbi:MAG: DUF2079 domain-containing protein [Polyangiaceae bacterium]